MLAASDSIDLRPETGPADTDLVSLALCRLGKVVRPRVVACRAFPAAHAHQQMYRILADRRVREPTRPRGTDPRRSAALGATPCGGPLRLAAYLPHAPASAHGQVPLHQGTQPQSVQAEQHPSVERAKLNAKPHGILHFFFHTTNETARPLHTKIGRAG